jgi:hypothetical protein
MVDSIQDKCSYLPNVTSFNFTLKDYDVVESAPITFVDQTREVLDSCCTRHDLSQPS